MSVSVVIPTIPPRAELLDRALASVRAQTLQPSSTIVVRDDERRGAAYNRNTGLSEVRSKWVAFLDDDDEFYPKHLQHCLQHAEETGADLVYPWFDLVGGTDPLGRFGMPFDPNLLRTANYIPVTVLVRTSLLRRVGGFEVRPGEGAPCEDWGAWLKLLDAGAKFSHLPERTWIWHHWGGNTSGRADAW